MQWWLLLALCGCGRVNFDLVGDGDAATSDGRGSDGSDASADAQPVAGDTCTSPRTIAIGDVLQNESITGALDDHTVGCGGGIDVVYRFMQPATGTRQVDVLADFSGSAWVNTSGGGCQLFFANMQYTGTPTVGAGTRYIVIEKTSGAGTSFTLGLQ